MEENKVPKALNRKPLQQTVYSVLYRKMEYCEDVNYPQIDAQIQCSPIKIPTVFHSLQLDSKQRVKKGQDIHKETCPIRCCDFSR